MKKVSVNNEFAPAQLDYLDGSFAKQQGNNGKVENEDDWDLDEIDKKDTGYKPTVNLNSQ